MNKNNKLLLNIKYFFIVPYKIKKIDRKNIKRQKQIVEKAKNNLSYASYKDIFIPREPSECCFYMYPGLTNDLIVCIEHLYNYTIYKCSFFDQCSKNSERKAKCSEKYIQEDIKIRETELQNAKQKLNELKKRRLDRVR